MLNIQILNQVFQKFFSKVFFTSIFFTVLSKLTLLKIVMMILDFDLFYPWPSASGLLSCCSDLGWILLKIWHVFYLCWPLITFRSSFKWVIFILYNSSNCISYLNSNKKNQLACMPLNSEIDYTLKIRLSRIIQ